MSCDTNNAFTSFEEAVQSFANEMLEESTPLGMHAVDITMISADTAATQASNERLGVPDPLGLAISQTIQRSSKRRPKQCAKACPSYPQQTTWSM